jgi:DNA-binding LacI/PurR family transcriptional regulator
VSERRQEGAARPTIYDVAQRANVSKSLVSLVMRGSQNVSEEKRIAVLRAASELGYRPNEHARALAQGRTRTVGVLISNLRNPFFAEVIEGLQEELGASRYRTLLGTGACDARRELGATETMLERGVEGMVLLSPEIPAEEMTSLARKSPTVIVGRDMQESTLDCVVNDDFSGAEMVVEHLAGLGHERIAHVSGGSGAGAVARRKGYEQAMQRLGLDSRVVYGEYTDEGGYWGTRQLLGAEPRPTAIFAANDFAAMGTFVAIDEAGLSVPEDVSVVGYDNTYLAELALVSLTSVDQPRRDMGVLAVRLLLERIESGRTEPRREVLKPRLIRRSTSDPPR